MDGFLAGQASLWVQPDGPNTEPKYLGCHTIGDIPEPKGDSTLLWCPDPSQVGKYKVKGSFRGEPGVITTSLETDLRKTADYLEDLADNGCPFPLFVHKVSCGRRDVFTNYDRSFVLRQVEVTTATLGKLSTRNPADEGESTQSFDLSARELMRMFNMEVARVSVTETEDITGFAVGGEQRCEGACGVAQKPEDDLYIVSKALVGSAGNTADVLHSENGGVWTVTPADPFIASMDIQGAVVLSMGRNSRRIIVGNGKTQAAHPCEIAYSDDEGVTWTKVHVGSTNAEYIFNSNSLCALDRYHIWVGSNLGRIYFSSDAGESWTVQEAAVISATAIMGVSFYDALNGFAVYTGGQVAITNDGETWSASLAVSGSASAMGIVAVSEYVAWVVGTDGMFFTKDGGATWTKRNSYAIGAIDFLNDMFGIAAGSGANGNIYMTIDGGYDWQVLPAITNGGFTSVTILSTKLAYVTGKISGGTGFLGKIIPV